MQIVAEESHPDMYQTLRENGKFELDGSKNAGIGKGWSKADLPPHC